MLKIIKFTKEERNTISLVLTSVINGYQENIDNRVINRLDENQVDNYQKTIDILTDLRKKFD